MRRRDLLLGVGALLAAERAEAAARSSVKTILFSRRTNIMPNPQAIFGPNLVAWWDFADASTVTQSGGFVDAVADKSGNGRTLTGTTTTRPAYSATGFHSFIGAAVFDGVDDILTTASFAPGFGSTCSVFAHAEFHTGIPAANARLVSFKADADARDFTTTASGPLLVLDGGGTTLQGGRGSSHLSTFSTTPLYGAQSLMAKQHGRYFSTFDGANNVLYVENNAATAVAMTAAFGSPGTISIGNLVGQNAAWKGAVTEVVVTKSVPTAMQRRQMMQWHTQRFSRIVVCSGDSIPHAGPTAANNIGYIYAAIPNLGANYYIVNAAIGGTHFDSNGSADYLGTGGPFIQPIVHALIPPAMYGQKYILYFGYSNNLGDVYTIQVGRNNATDYATEFSAAAAAAKAAGYAAVVTNTVMSRTDAQANDTLRNTINPLLRTAANFTTIADFAANATMGIDAAPTVNPGDFADQVHPNVTGNAICETIWRPAVLSVG